MYLVGDLDNEKWLVQLLERLAVHVFEVSRDVDFLTIVREEGLQWGCLEIDVLDEVAATVAPVSDDWLAAELEPGYSLRLVLAVSLLLDLVETVQTGLRRHELEDIVNGKHTPKLTVVGRGLEP